MFVDRTKPHGWSWVELQSGMEIHCKSIGKSNTKLYNERFTSLQLLEKPHCNPIVLVQHCWKTSDGKFEVQTSILH